MPTLLMREHEGRYEGFCSPGVDDDNRLQFSSSSPGSYALPVFVLCFYQPYVSPISQYTDQEVCTYFKYALKSPMRLKTHVYGIQLY